MQLKYHEAAEKAGVYVVGACGFDSIPADMGTCFVHDKFDGDLNGIESYFQVNTGPKVGTGSDVSAWCLGVYRLDVDLC